jgi:hypothetical protein
MLLLEDSLVAQALLNVHHTNICICFGSNGYPIPTDVFTLGFFVSGSSTNHNSQKQKNIHQGCMQPKHLIVGAAEGDSLNTNI